MSTYTPLADGLYAFVKRACPTCTLIEPQLQEAAKAVPGFHPVTQDDPGFPARVPGVIDDRALDHSYMHGIESTPTLVRIEGGRETDRVVGWDRAGWQRLTGIATLGASLPALRPG